jgi:dTDP-4-dehydrorhamnose 3,5-epimerase
MQVVSTELPGVLLLEPKVFGDDRGFFFESYNRRAFHKATGVDVEFVQDNHSRSKKNVLRGLHYQIQHAQGKLVRAVSGESGTWRWICAQLPDLRQVGGLHALGRVEAHGLDPPGFAHGFVVVSETADVLYKATDYYAPEHERTLLWNDPALGIRWPLAGTPILTEKDRKGTPLAGAEVFA